MNKIELVDLHTQYDRIESEINSAIMNVIKTTAFINGPDVKSFEKELATYLDVKHVIGCANGTDALQIALMALGLEPGDEVITPSFTYIATAEVIALLRLKPVLVEIDPNTFTIDPSSFEKAITPNTKAVIAVHLYGQCANMEEILAIAAAKNVAVVEDTAQGIGAWYTFKDGTKKRTGTMGHIGTTSFFPSKNLGCYGDGGAMFTNDDALAEKIRMIANHGQKKKYYHDVIGVNSRLDTMQAAILRVKLPHLDSYIEARQKAAAYYDNALKNNPKIKTPFIAEYSNHTYHQYTMVLEGVDRDALMQKMTEAGIPTNVYYPLPIHKQKGFQQYGFNADGLQLTEALTAKVLSLPMHTELSEEQLEYITKTLLENI